MSLWALLQGKRFRKTHIDGGDIAGKGARNGKGQHA